MNIVDAEGGRVTSWPDPHRVPGQLGGTVQPGVLAEAARLDPDRRGGKRLGEDAGLYGAAKLAWDSVRVWP